MASLNKATLIGNLGKDPEIRSTQAGKEIASFSLATSQSWTDKETGERKTATEWHHIVIFNENLVRTAKSFLKKGSKVYLEGEIKTRKWTDQSGVEKYSTEIILQGFGSQIVMLDGKKDSDDQGQQAVNEAYAPHQQAKQNGYAPSDELDDDIPF